jgi:hypothetical protein
MENPAQSLVHKTSVFGTLESFNPMPTSRFVTTADFSGDGKPDVVAANEILLGKGDGTFRQGIGFDPDISISTAAGGDFNGDGKADLVVIGCPPQGDCPNPVVVLLGMGNGTFQPPLSLNPGSLPLLFVTAADLNHDGLSDLMLGTCSIADCEDGQGVLSILLGKGDGTFHPGVNYPLDGFFPSSAAVADLNGDGKIDIVVSNENCGNFTCANGTLSVLLGNGDGSFQPQVPYSAGDLDSASVAVGDFNGDGVLDLAVANMNVCCLETASVGVLLGRGDGTFQTVVNYPSKTRGYSIAASDVDGDGNLDVVLSNATVFLGNGDGTLQPLQSYNVQPDAPTFEVNRGVVADFNGDGKPDLMVADFGFLFEYLNISTGFRHATSTRLISSRNPAEVHQHVTFTAVVTSTSQGTPSGTVTFSDGGHALATQSVFHGRANFTTDSLDAGIHIITSRYDGDQTFQSSTSPALHQAIKVETRVNLSSSSNPSRPGHAVTFTAVVQANSGETPTGTVTFKDSFGVLGRVTLSGGHASFTTSHPHRGTHVVRAEYSGSSIDECSSDSIRQHVK